MPLPYIFCVSPMFEVSATNTHHPRGDAKELPPNKTVTPPLLPRRICITNIVKFYARPILGSTYWFSWCIYCCNVPLSAPSKPDVFSLHALVCRVVLQHLQFCPLWQFDLLQVAWSDCLFLRPSISTSHLSPNPFTLAMFDDTAPIWLLLTCRNGCVSAFITNKFRAEVGAK